MLDGLTLDQMRTFVAVAETGSFRAGAARLRRAQSAISHAIANLETQLGVALFDRSGHKPALTPEGKALLADARAILLKVDLMRGRARGLNVGVELELSITVNPLFPLPVVAGALAEMHEAFPTVAMRIWSAPLGAAHSALLEGRSTFSITTGDIEHPAVEMEALVPIEVVAVAAPAHALGTRDDPTVTVAATELAEHVQIVVADPSPLTEGRDFNVFSPRTWRVGDMETKRALIIEGVGWGSLPRWLVERDLEEGRLVVVPAAPMGHGGQTSVRTFLAHRTDTPLGPAAGALRERFLKCIGVAGEKVA